MSVPAAEPEPEVAKPEEVPAAPPADAGLTPAEQWAARVEAGREAARRAGDTVVVEPNAWTLQTLVKEGLPPYRIRVEGSVVEGGGDDQVVVGAGGASLAGPPVVAVYRGGQLLQRVKRQSRTPDPLDLNSFAGVEPMSLDKLPMREDARLYAGDIELGDVNFDGAMDLHVTVGMAHKCAVVRRFLFQPSTGKFVEHKVLSQLNCLSWIADRELVVSHEWTCCEDWYLVFHWEGSRLVLEREIWRERGEGGRGRITYHEMQDGKPVKRVEETTAEKAEP